MKVVKESKAYLICLFMVISRICDNIRFKHGSAAGESEEEVDDSETFGILDHQFVFWVGYDYSIIIG